MRVDTRKIGTSSEDKACEYLLRNGFRIVERNYFARKLGEIDIVAFKDGALHFVEVKSGFQSGLDPVYNLTPVKLKRVVNAAHYYLKHKNLDMPYCIDAIIVRNDRIRFLPNITL